MDSFSLKWHITDKGKPEVSILTLRLGKDRTLISKRKWKGKEK